MKIFAYVAEFLATLLLISTVYASNGNPLAIGGILSLIITLTGGISGAHVNPAISFSLYLKGALKLEDFLGYIGVQFLAGMVALYAFKTLRK